MTDKGLDPRMASRIWEVPIAQVPIAESGYAEWAARQAKTVEIGDDQDARVRASMASAQSLQRAHRFLDKIEANAGLTIAETALLACAAAFDAGWYSHAYDAEGVNPLLPEVQS